MNDKMWQEAEEKGGATKLGRLSLSWWMLRALSRPLLSRRLFSTNMASIEQLTADIKSQGDVVRQLKADKVDKDQLQPQLDALAKLKEQLARLKPDDGKGKGKAKKAFTLKTPKVQLSVSRTELQVDSSR